MNRQLYSFGPFELDLEEQVLRREGQPLALKPKVFDLLVVLVENSGRVVSKDELMKQVWAGTFVEEGNLTVSWRVSALLASSSPSTDGPELIPF